ncbi:mucin-5AC [Chelonus insularis]|uniref:mucin-5AC n=1 Tax=Chelonus insularis TaxID=460826 RepID=UPI001589B74F|nr:mucin-5AC [Chelonus insularis]
MKILFGWLPILATILINLQWASSIPVSKDEMTISSKGRLVSRYITVTDPQKRIYSSKTQPPSPIHFFSPDKIYYYTHDINGGMVVKEMTEKEIQSLIAAGSGNLPVPVQESSKVEELQPGGTKVSDVVTNVKKVVGSELSKPTPTITAIPTIPGHANSEWSNILPSILSGESDSGASSQPISQPQESAKPSVVKYPDVYPSSYQEPDEKPMIPVPMITVEKPNHHEKEKDGKPVYEILNTIPAEKAGTTSVNQSAVDQDQVAGASEAVKPVLVTSSTSKPESLNNDKNYYNILHTAVSPEDTSNGENKKDTVSVIAESSSTSVKISGQDEIKIHQEEILKPMPVVSSTTQKTEDLSKTDSTVIEETEVTIDPTEIPMIEILTEKLTEAPLLDKTEFTTISGPIIELAQESSSSEINPSSSYDKDNSNNSLTPSSSESSVDLIINGESDIIKNIASTLSNPSQIPVEIIDMNISTPPHITLDTHIDASTSDFNLITSTEQSQEKVENSEQLYSEIPALKPVIQLTEKKENISGITTESSIKTESISQELTDSLSSMLNQVSEAMPSRIPSGEDQKSRNPDADKTKIEPVDTELESKESVESNEFKVEDLITTEIPLSTIYNELLSATNSPNIEEKSTEFNYLNETTTQAIMTEPEMNKFEEKDSEINISTESPTIITTVYPEIVELKESYSEITLSPEIIQSEEKKPVTDIIKETNTSNTQDIKVNNKDSEVDNKLNEATTPVDITSTEGLILEVKESTINMLNGTLSNNTTLNTVEDVKVEKIPEITTSSESLLEITTLSSEKTVENTSTSGFIEVKTPEIPDKSSETDTLNESLAPKAENNEPTNDKKPVEVTTESPIVRINVSDSKENDNMQKDEPTKNTENIKNVTESTMVRIKLTNPVSTINAMIESSTLQNTTPIYETLTLPPTENLTANGLASGLIAGFDVESNTDKKIIKETEAPMQTIQFDQLPIINDSVKLENLDVTTTTEITTKESTTELTSTTSVSINKDILPLEAENKENIAILSIDTPKNTSSYLNSPETNKTESTSNLPITSTESTLEMLNTSTPLAENKTDAPVFSSTINEIVNTENKVSSTEAPIIVVLSTKIPQVNAIENVNSTASEIQNRPKDQKKETSMEIVEKVSTLSPSALPKVEEAFPTSTEHTQILSTTTTPKPSDPTNWIPVPQPDEPVKSRNDSLNISKPSGETEAQPPVALDHSKTTPALDTSTQNLEPDIAYFSNLCNDLAFTLWTAINNGLSTSRSLAVSPFGMTSMLAMIFLGARGTTSNQMNDVLKLDDVSSFNPHLVFQNISDSVSIARNQGIANAVFVRELFADKIKVRKLLPFYKEQAQQFYDGIVAEVNFAFVSDVIRRRTNLMVRKQTGGRIRDFVKSNPLPLRSPLAALSANVFQTDCSSSDATSEGRDGELYFAVSPAVRQRKLIPVPATLWKAGVLAGYEPNLDATAIALGGLDKIVSTIFIVPGQPGATAPGDNLYKLEHRLVEGALHDGTWNKLLKVIIPRPGLELQIPKFSHRSIINATSALKSIRLHELFDKHADLKGINGIGHDLHLADVFQMNLFSTCGDENILSGKHHEEIYPASPQRNARVDENNLKNEQDKFEDIRNHSDDDDEDNNRLAKFSRQVENEKPRLKLDRPFLYVVRHNPTGLILHMGRFNPRLLP